MASALALAPLAFAVTAAVYPWFIEAVRRWGARDLIRAEGPRSHAVKAGTPTMGGLVIVVAAVVCSLPFAVGGGWAQLAPLYLTLLVFGAFGVADDVNKLLRREGHGFPVRYKLLTFALLGAGLGALLRYAGDDQVNVPGLGTVRLGAWFLLLSAVVVLGGSSAAIIDGLDGLAGGTMAIAFAAYLVIALRHGNLALAAFCAATVGALLGFLWFNVHPARIFMGDTGSVPLGAALATAALVSGQVLLLPVIGFVFVVDVLSVAVQVAYFKSTGGKRLLRMSPIHHHFELCGWPEVRVTLRFWLVAAVAAFVGLALDFL